MNYKILSISAGTSPDNQRLAQQPFPPHGGTVPTGLGQRGPVLGRRGQPGHLPDRRVLLCPLHCWPGGEDFFTDSHFHLIIYIEPFST